MIGRRGQMCRRKRVAVEMRVRRTIVKLTVTTERSGKPSRSSAGVVSSDEPKPVMPPTVAARKIVSPART